MKRIYMLLIIMSIIMSNLFINTTAYAEIPNEGNADIAIVFTHDLHSHIDPFMYNGNSVGGFSRIKTIIDKTKNEYPNTLVLDGGDFSMGTLYQTVFETQAAEYSLLGELGYDAVTFGNHEFDYGFDAVKNMISSAQNNYPSLPPILCSNINTDASNLSESTLASLNILEYTLIKKGDYSIAVFGVLGRDAAELSSSGKLIFDDYIEAAKNTVSEIQKLHSPDMIICLSHGGTGPDVDDEDVELANEVPDIDLIISGHTHTFLSEPIIIGDTVIASCGEYGMNVGKVLFEIDNNEAKFVSYSLTEINDKIERNHYIDNKIDQYKGYINEYLKRFGYNSPDDIISHSTFDFPEQNSMGNALAEQQLGNLISDSYIHSIKKAEGSSYVPVDVAVAPLGVIRASIDKGGITVSQVFEISSLGIGNDGVSGYPLCSVYLYGYELWDLAEVDASVSAIMPYAQLYCSGLGYSVNTNRMFLDRVYDCWLIDENGNRIEIDDNKLYRVVSGMSSAQMLGTVKSKSFGLLELTPKDSNANEIVDFNKHIATDNNGAEVKEWKALADYLSSFEKGQNGIPSIPARYSALEGRKNINHSFSFSQIFTNWSLISWIALILILLIIGLIVLITVTIVKKIKKKKRLKASFTEELE